MKKSLILLGTFLLLGAEIVNAKPWDNLVGTWEYRMDSEDEPEWLILKNTAGKFHGEYFGREHNDGSGTSFYAVDVKNLEIKTGGTIEFTIPERLLAKDRPTKVIRGEGAATREILQFKGKINESGKLVLNCTNQWGVCAENVRVFKKRKP